MAYSDVGTIPQGILTGVPAADLAASAHYALLARVRTFVETLLPVAERWTVLESDVSTDDHWVIWEAPGLSGTDSVFLGMKTYQDVGYDYYNLTVAVFTGWVDGNSFETQTGAYRRSLSLWNQDTPYWLRADGQGISLFAKIESSYQSLFIGKCLPYATPSQFPYPICIGAMFDAGAATRYSESTAVSWFKGGQFYIRDLTGTFLTPDMLPYYGTETLRNTNDDAAVAEGVYALHPVIITTGDDVFGELDGVYFISGFNNNVENTLVIDSVNYIVMRNGTETGYKDYIALRLD